MFLAFATTATSRLERSRQWCARTRIEHMAFDDDRQASMRGGEFGPLRVCSVSMGRHRAAHSAAVRAAPTLKFLFQEEGSATVEQEGRANRIEAGQWCALRKDLDFVIHAPDRSRQLAITVPCSVLPGPRRGLHWWRQPRSFLRGAAQILHASASASLMNGGILTPADCDRLGAQIAVLAEMTIRADDPGPLADAREGRRRAILAFIDRHLADSELGVAMVARAFGMSTRAIHKLFENEAFTIARIIAERRLDRCREQLRDPSLATQSITEIAHRWGFSDSQHFSRAFKQHLGLTPRDYRQFFALH